MKKIFITITLLMFANLCFAGTYAIFDKETGECKGVTSIKDDYVSDWAKNYILKKADESYRGKQGYEIILENGKLRNATKEEITDYLSAQETEINQKRKQDALDNLGLTDEDLAKIKELQ